MMTDENIKLKILYEASSDAQDIDSAFAMKYEFIISSLSSALSLTVLS